MELTPFDESDLMAEVNAEIARLGGAHQYNKIVLSPVQAEGLIAMRAAGLKWMDISRFFKARGLCMSEKTIRRVYREVVEDAEKA
jgi:hypothetical protein